MKIQLVDATMSATAAVKDASNYQFYVYDSKAPFPLLFRGKDVLLKSGTKFGLRASSNGKAVRLVIDKDLTRVITITGAERALLEERSSKMTKSESDREGRKQVTDSAFTDEVSAALAALWHKFQSATVPTSGVVDAMLYLAEGTFGVSKDGRIDTFEDLTTAGRKKCLAYLDKAMKTKLGSMRAPANLKPAQKIALQIFNNAMKNKELLGEIKGLKLYPDSGLPSIGIQDAANHVQLAHYLWIGDMANAKKRSYFDTASRDLVPDRAWDWIQDNLR